MHRQHHYKLTTTWNGNRGSGTNHVAAYDRSHTITMDNKPELRLTTDNEKFGDRSKPCWWRPSRRVT
jgi:hypothetical protein